MEDSWVYIDGDDSSNSSLADSDKIDSETEAELYSRIHHEPNVFCINSENINEQSSGVFVYTALKDDILCMNEKKTESTFDTNEHLCLNIKSENNFSNEKRKSSEMETDCKIFNEKLNPAKKIKTESVCQGSNVNLDSKNLINTNDSSKFTINNISNIKKETVKQESSDSDSDIWIEENSAENSDLKINLLKDTETIFVSSSDSDSEFDITSSFQKRDSFLRNLSMPNIKTEDNSKDVWYINSEDLRRSKKQSHRYHDNFDITCSNCNKKGHTFRTCPSPRVIKCFICGGNHMGFRCPKRVCSNCHTIGHDRRNCHREVCRDFCHLCNMEGHAKGNCPDIWRRYHLTTRPFELKKGKQVQQNTNLYCWNCGKCGHFGAVCPLSHLSRNSFSTLPCVISYAHPRNLLKIRLSVLKKYSYLSLQKLNRSVNNISNISSKNKDHLGSKNKLNVSGGSNEENGGNKKGRKKFRTAFRFDKVQDIVNGKDFPRTSKKSPNKCSSTFVKSKEGTESALLLMRNQLKKLQKRWNQQFKKYGVQAFESQTPNDISRISSEECSIDFDVNLPESVKIRVAKRFKRWKKNRLRNIRRKLNKACKMEES